MRFHAAIPFSLATGFALLVALVPESASAENTRAYLPDPTLPFTRELVHDIFVAKQVVIEARVVSTSGRGQVDFRARRPRMLSHWSWTRAKGSFELGEVPSECASVGFVVPEDASAWEFLPLDDAQYGDVGWLRKHARWKRREAPKFPPKKSESELLLERRCKVRLQARRDLTQAGHFRVQALRDGVVIAEVSPRQPVALPDPEPIAVLPLAIAVDALQVAVIPVLIVLYPFSFLF